MENFMASNIWPETSCPKCRGTGWAHIGKCKTETVKLDNHIIKTPYDGYVVTVDTFTDIRAAICDCNAPAATILRSNRETTFSVISRAIVDKLPGYEIMLYDSGRENFKTVMQEKAKAR